MQRLAGQCGSDLCVTLRRLHSWRSSQWGAQAGGLGKPRLPGRVLDHRLACRSCKHGICQGRVHALSCCRLPQAGRLQQGGPLVTGLGAGPLHVQGSAGGAWGLRLLLRAWQPARMPAFHWHRFQVAERWQGLQLLRVLRLHTAHVPLGGGGGGGGGMQAARSAQQGGACTRWLGLQAAWGAASAAQLPEVAAGACGPLCRLAHAAQPRRPLLSGCSAPSHADLRGALSAVDHPGPWRLGAAGRQERPAALKAGLLCAASLTHAGWAGRTWLAGT